MQNYAVFAQREPSDGYDDFPTPPWATRALMEYVIGNKWQNNTCLEPACGGGYMSRTLREYFSYVGAYDILNYGDNQVRDFLTYDYRADQFDWIITNPPFKHAEAFINRALELAHIGIAIFARTSFVESVGRYNRIFKANPPAFMAFFVERVPINQGKMERDNTTATCYSWFVWLKRPTKTCTPIWIPPCRSLLERNEDYEPPPGTRRRVIL